VTPVKTPVTTLVTTIVKMIATLKSFKNWNLS